MTDMGTPDENDLDRDRLPEDLIERLDSLDIPALRAVISHAGQRIESLHKPIEEEIRASASGEIIDIEDEGAYALVRKYLPNPDGSGVNTDTISLFHVSREKHPDGEESLHWSYLGDVETGEHVKCERCGRTYEENLTNCPHCGSGEVDNSGMGG